MRTNHSESLGLPSVESKAMKNASRKHESPTGWWIASYIERAAWDDAPRLSGSARCTAWENTIILKAKTRESAYSKAVKLGAASKSTFSDPSGTRTGRWIFEGLTSLLPIYDDLQDGTEILWVDHSGRTLKKLRALVKKKSELEVFDSGD